MNAESFPTFLRLWRFIRRCLRRLRLVFFSRRSVVVYLVLGTLVFLAYTIDRWHGRRVWAAEKERLAAAGESLDLRELLPKRPPDEENFFAIPEFAKLGDPSDRHAGRDVPLQMWRARDSVERTNIHGKTGRFRVNYPKQGMEAPLSEWCAYFRETGMLPKQPLSPDPAKELVLSAERWQALLNAMYAASERPAAVFLPAPVERLDADGQMKEYASGIDTTLQITKLADSLTLHGRACLETGDVRTALQDILVLRRIAEAFGNEYWFLVFGGYIHRHTGSVFITGVRRHLWRADDLSQIEKNGATDSISEGYRAALLVGRAIDTFYIQHPNRFQIPHSKEPYYYYDLRWKWPWLRSLVEQLAPEGPIIRFCAERSRWHSRYLDAVDQLAPGETWLQRRERVEFLPGPAAPTGIRVQSGGPIGHLEMYIPIILRQHLLRVTCALERHYLVHRRYPAALSEISASLSPEVVTDIDGQPFRYRTPSDGSMFRLWSVGRNGKDDTGTKDADDDWSFSTE